MWSGVEPQMGVFNETYIEVMSDMLDVLEKNGMAAIIDVHQDVLSSYFCLYDGAPTWLVDLSTSSKKEFPWPLKWDGENPCPGDRQWGLNYMAEATGAAFQDIYDNVNGMRDHFATFWAKVATSFKDKNILGYEIINEPWAGNVYQQPSLLLPGVAGSQNLQPLYDSISAAIRESDPDHIIFYEPVTWGMIFNGTVSGSGFTHVPGGHEHADKSVFSFHYYCWWFSPDQPDQMVKQTCDRMFGPKVFDQVKEDVRILGGSAMMTEWGLGCDPTYGITEECNPIMDLADEHLFSWTDWWWTGPLMSGWNAAPEAIAFYSRTYAQAVAGKPTKMKFEADSLNFELCYDVNPTISSPTEIFASSSLHYTSGFNIRITGNAASFMDAKISSDDSSKILVSYSGPAESSELLSCCINVSPKK
jgi:endoglycosylceramidase